VIKFKARGSIHMRIKRKYMAKFKVKVSSEAAIGDKTISQITSKI